MGTLRPCPAVTQESVSPLLNIHLPLSLSLTLYLFFLLVSFSFVSPHFLDCIHFCYDVFPSTCRFLVWKRIRFDRTNASDGLLERHKYNDILLCSCAWCLAQSDTLCNRRLVNSKSIQGVEILSPLLLWSGILGFYFLFLASFTIQNNIGCYSRVPHVHQHACIPTHRKRK